MPLSRVKTWSPGDILTAADLNAEFNNIINNSGLLAGPVTLLGFLNANFPPATSAGQLIRATDGTRGVRMSQGSQWFSLSGAIINVQEFGATGNGTTDDTAAFQAALNAVPSSGAYVFVPTPSVSYLISSTLTVSNPTRLVLGGGTLTLGGSPGILVSAAGCSIIGAGQAVSVLNTTSATADLIQANGALFSLRDLDITVNNTIARTSAQSIIKAGSTQGLVEKVRILGTATNGGNLFRHVGAGNGSWTYRDIQIIGGGTFTDGWFLQSGVSTVAGTYVDNVLAFAGSTFTGQLFNLDTGVDTFVAHFIQSGATGLMIHTQNTLAGQAARWLHFINCRLEAGGSATTNPVIKIDDARDFKYLDGYLASGQNAAVINGGNQIDISHNEVVNFGQHAFLLAAAPTNVTLSRNQLEDIGITTNNTYDYFNVAAGAQDFAISGNHFRQLNANKARYGINLLAGATNFFSLVENDFASAAIGTAYVNNLATGGTQHIWANKGGIGNLTKGTFATTIPQFVQSRQTLVYGATIATDTSTGNVFVVTVTDGAAHTLGLPTNPAAGQTVTWRERNTFGAIATMTFNAVFKLGAAWTAPANGFSRAITFEYDGTNWVEQTRSAADVSN